MLTEEFTVKFGERGRELPAILDELPAEEAGLPVLTNELHPLTEEFSEAPPK